LTETPGRVLVADDDAVILRLLEVNFSLDGFDVVTASGGEEALGKALGEGPFDLIVLDVMMPGMDGWQVCEALKENEGTAGVPVMFLSARTQDQDRVRGMRLGVSAYVTKPFDPDELLRLARRLVGGPQT
jgi:DNA-binding response OmpR family regulator